jgi:soluble lytic murein transglycosylase-like protein
LAFLLSPVTGYAAVYFYEAPDGITHYSDQATDARYQLLIADVNPQPGPTDSQNGSPRSQRSYEREIAAVAHATQVEAALLHAVIAVESNYNPRAISPKGALGLMQLMPATARQYGIKNPMDVQQNIQGGAQHLRKLLDYFSNNKSLALAAYNAGLGAVITHGGQIPPFAETRSYVPEVLRRYASNRLLVPAVSE